MPSPAIARLAVAMITLVHQFSEMTAVPSLLLAVMRRAFVLQSE
jgi:hypothetical protein